MAESRKLANAALAVPVFGLALVVPPLINVFDVPILVFGVPLEVAYLFVVWTGLIAVTAFLSYRMRPPSGEPRESGSRSDDGERS